MAAAADDLIVRLRAVGAKKAARDIDTTSNSVRRFGNNADRAHKKSLRATSSVHAMGRGMGSLRLYATGAAEAMGIIGLGLGIKTVVEDSIDLQKQLNRTNVLFGANREEMISWAEEAAKSMGMSKANALGAAASFGGLLKTMGFATDTSAKMSKKLVQISADIGSFKNMDPAQVQKALIGGIGGMTRGLKKLGIGIDANEIKQKALAMGLYDGKGALDQSAKAAAVYQLILEKTKNVQGQFKKHSHDTAEEQKILSAELHNMSEDLGSIFIPAMATLVGWFAAGASAANDLFLGYKRNKTWAGLLGSVIIGLTAGMIAYYIATGIAAGVTAIAGGVWIESAIAVTSFGDAVAFAALMMEGLSLASGIGIIVAIGVAFYLAYKKVKPFHDAVDASWRFIKDHWRELAPLLLGPLAPLAEAILHFKQLKSVAMSVFHALKGGVGAAIHWIANRIRSLLTFAGKAVHKLAGLPVIKQALGVAKFEAGVYGKVAGAVIPGGGGGNRRTRPQLGGGGGSKGGAGNRPGDVVIHHTTKLDGKVVAKSTERQSIKKKSTR